MAALFNNSEMTSEWLHTAEVRWFFPLDPSPNVEPPPRPPASVLAWFQDGLDNLEWPPQPRTDRYLLLPGCTTTGVKLREGRLEVKALCGPSDPVTLPHNMTGLADKWVKWSYGGPAAAPLTAVLGRETAGWLAVTKWRLLRAFTITEAGVTEVTENEPVTAENTVELTAVQTAVQAHSQSWWTLGLEAGGDPEKLEENFQQLADYFFGRTKPPLVLDKRHSCAYPAWIESIT
jgi:hypothetical protein